MTSRRRSMPITEFLADVAPSAFGERGNALLDDGGELASRADKATDFHLQFLAVNDMHGEQGAAVGLVVEPQILNTVEEDFPADRLVEHYGLPNPFITEPATRSSLAETPAASTRLKCGDAAGPSTPLGGTATAPGMARGSSSDFSLVECVHGCEGVETPPSPDAPGDADAAVRFKLDEAAFMRAMIGDPHISSPAV